MRDVAKHMGLVRRGGTYSLRVVVPKDIRAAFAPIWSRERKGRRPRRAGAELSQVWIPLGTGDRKVAAETAAIRRVWLASLFREAQDAAGLRGAPGQVTQGASLEAIHRAARAYFYDLERKAPPVPMDPEERERALEEAIQEAGAAEAIDATDGMLQRVAMSVAEKHRINIPSDSPLTYELFSSILEAEREYLTRQTERMALEVVRQRHALFADINPSQPPARVMTLREAVDAYKSAPERANRSPKTKAAWNFRLGAWCDLLGADKPVSAITRADVKTGRDTLMVVPANAAKRWRGMPLVDVAERARKAGIPPMHRKSVQLYVDAFASLMKWLTTEGELASNPSTGIGAPGQPQHEEAARRRLTTDELRRLFASGPYAKPSAARGWKFWLPLIALFEGMRLSEILGLRAEDVAERDGVPVFDIKGHAGRSLKTFQSARVVPVHPMLQDMGFLEFAARQPAGGLLFTDLPGGADDPLNAAQKAMGRFFRSTFPNTPALVFHSLRHTWKHAAENAYVPEAMLERLGGWKKPGRSAMSGYGDGYRPSVLATELEKVAFDGLDLSKLRLPSR